MCRTDFVSVSHASRVSCVSEGFAHSARRRSVVRRQAAGQNPRVPRFSTRKLSTQILLAQLAILTATVLVGFVLFARVQGNQLDHQYEDRAAVIAEVVAGVPDIQSCLSGPGSPCPESVQSVATRITAETHASYIVVIDMQRVRHSHPIPSLIGQKVAEPIVTVDGRVHVGIDHGNLGVSANAKAPLYSTDHRMIGEVSVGTEESSVSSALWHELPTYAGWLALALAAGAAASVLLAHRLKRKTFGLELDEIARLLQEREATLHGIREGVLAFDPRGRVSVVNDEARKLLGGIDIPLGCRLEDVLPAGRLRQVLSVDANGPHTRMPSHDTTSSEDMMVNNPQADNTMVSGDDLMLSDEMVVTDDYCLTVSRMPVVLNGRVHGAVVTLRDRTETSGLLRELDGVRRLTDALRAQQHEFSNRLHAVTGLLELGQVNQALAYLADLNAGAADFAETLRARVGSPLIVGLLLGKSAEASERGVTLEITDDTWLSEATPRPQALTTILGNLIDNALESLAAAGAATLGGRVSVGVTDEDGDVRIDVADTGPGLLPGTTEVIFHDGYSTKPSSAQRSRGLGLALVHQLVQRLDGTITVTEGPNPTFHVFLPAVPSVVRTSIGTA